MMHFWSKLPSKTTTTLVLCSPDTTPSIREQTRWSLVLPLTSTMKMKVVLLTSVRWTERRPTTTWLSRRKPMILPHRPSNWPSPKWRLGLKSMQLLLLMPLLIRFTRCSCLQTKNCKQLSRVLQQLVPRLQVGVMREVLLLPVLWQKPSRIPPL